MISVSISVFTGNNFILSYLLHCDTIFCYMVKKISLILICSLWNYQFVAKGFLHAIISVPKFQWRFKFPSNYHGAAHCQFRTRRVAIPVRAPCTSMKSTLAENNNNNNNNIPESFDYNLQPISDESLTGDTFLNDGEDFPSDDDLAQIPNGQKGGYKVIRHYKIPTSGLHDTGGIDIDPNISVLDEKDLMCNTISLQAALCLLDPENYPSLTRARKACRKGFVLIHRGSIDHEMGLLNAFKSKKCVRGRVGDNVFPGDIVGIQVMMGAFKKKRSYPFITYSRPRFAMPVLYEDDYMAIVDKPAGISMYGKRKSRGGSTSRRTVRDVLPYCLTPPKKGTPGQCLKRPMAVHRLDTPTSGLLVVAKTKFAMDSLYRQFEERRVIKTYTAIVNGIPQNCEPLAPTSGEFTPNALKGDNDWNIVDFPLGGRHAITTWRVLESGDSLHAKDQTLTLVEVQPRTGRYHQIRRHMAWICRRPLVGDALYAGALQATRFRRNGLYLCSNGIRLDHPCYSTLDWNAMASDDNTRNLCLSEDNRTVQVSVTKDLPKRFSKLLKGEHAWANASSS